LPVTLFDSDFLLQIGESVMVEARMACVFEPKVVSRDSAIQGLQLSASSTSLLFLPFSYTLKFSTVVRENKHLVNLNVHTFRNE
jgi:hypothetical protein